MKTWRDFHQGWTLRKAIKQGCKASMPNKIDHKSGLLLVFPSDPALAKTIALTVGQWLEDHKETNVRVIVPLKAMEVTKKLKRGTQTVSFEESDFTRSGVPVRELRKRVSNVKANVAVLLSEEYDPFTETLFALVPSRLKAALYHEARSSYANLLVKTKENHSKVKTVLFLLDSISTFAGNHVKLDADSDTAKRASINFSKKNEEKTQPVNKSE